VVSLILLTVTLLISILTYRRNKKIELQNQLYKIKLEAFANIVFEIELFSTKATKALSLIVRLAEQNQIDISKQKLFEMADTMDEELYKCNSIIVKNSVYFSASSTELLSTFASNIFGNKKDNTEENLKMFLDEFDEYYTNQLELANKAVEKVREELGLECRLPQSSSISN
jgi:hypothetical protein